jgi:hypothetical protein
MAFIQPSLRGFGNSKLFPALKRQAIVIASLRDSQPPNAPIVHTKMNIGKECSSAECARLRSRLHFRLRLTSARQVVTTRRVASTRQGVRSAPQFDFRHRQRLVRLAL